MLIDLCETVAPISDALSATYVTKNISGVYITGKYALPSSLLIGSQLL